MKKSNFLSALAAKCKAFFTTNIAIKIVAVVFALLLWGYVLADQNPERIKQVENVPVSTEGANELLARSLILVTDDLGTVDVAVSAEITRHREIDATRVSCVAKLNTITTEGAYTLPLDVTVQSGLGTVVNVTPGTVKVEVDRLIKKSVPVKLEYEGELPEGFEIKTASFPTTITVEGAMRYITPIRRAVATVSLDALRADYEGAVDVVFYDAEDEVLDVVTRYRDVPSIAVQLDITATKRVPVTVDLTTPDPTYYSTGYVSSMPEVVLWGDADALADIETVYTEPIVATTDMDGEVVETMLMLPDTVELKTGYTPDLRVTVTVTERVETVKQQMEATLLHLSDLFAVSEPVMVELEITGTVAELEKWKPEQVTLTVSARDLGIGEHTVPLSIAYEGPLTIQAPAEVTFTIAHK